MNDAVSTVVGALGTGGLVTIIMWILQSGSRRAERDQAERAADAERFTSVISAWEAMNKPLSEEVAALRAEVESLRAGRAEDHRRIAELTRELLERDELLAASLSLNQAYRAWADAGAKPPPPTTTSPALRTRLNL